MCGDGWWMLKDRIAKKKVKERNSMDMKCMEARKCIYRKPSGNCLILCDTKFNKPCPFRKETAANRSKKGHKQYL
ncbi:MAG: hypothetical protein GX235_08980 [Clostridiales bacterium]|nr:hypothetical protein [Clostridiales bacterium]